MIRFVGFLNVEGNNCLLLQKRMYAEAMKKHSDQALQV